jgi:hypothetical protein
MTEKFRIRVFGKRGCDKCAVLNQRLDKLLADDALSPFEKEYLDVETEDGLVAFSEAECINPQRIPAMLIMKQAGDTEWTPVLNPIPEAPAAVYKKSKLYQYLGLQTDYSDIGKGLLSPKMIAACLEEVVAR